MRTIFLSEFLTFDKFLTNNLLKISLVKMSKKNRVFQSLLHFLTTLKTQLYYYYFFYFLTKENNILVVNILGCQKRVKNLSKTCQKLQYTTPCAQTT